jgi:hypothetical protein
LLIVEAKPNDDVDHGDDWLREMEALKAEAYDCSNGSRLGRGRRTSEGAVGIISNAMPGLVT